jgi:hypothetical protein
MNKPSFSRPPQRRRVRRAVTIAVTMNMLLITGMIRLHAQAWNMQWSDEFNVAAGAAPNSNSWTYDTGGGGWGNGELEVYCAPYSGTSPCDPNNSNIYQDGGGNLVIKAINNNGTWTRAA